MHSMLMDLLSSISIALFFGFLLCLSSIYRLLIVQANGCLRRRNEKCQPHASEPRIYTPLLRHYQMLYFHLHNLEEHSEILPQCRKTLLQLFSAAISKARPNAASPIRGSILNVDTYSLDALGAFIRDQNDRIGQDWEAYLMKRRNGAPRELFQTAEEAVLWLKQAAPVKLVDGAWLGHINAATTPYALRSITKDAWQVLSEELGDGDVAKNHVSLFMQLLGDVGIALPPSYSRGFIDEHLSMNDTEIWESAVGQLLVSLFPHEFLPEILGFNLQFELITMDTLRASKELRELGINPYYFTVHVTIDNIDSGHGAIAMHAVGKYLEHIRAAKGDKAVQPVWRRIQVGYLLSESLSTSPRTSEIHRPTLLKAPRSALEAELMNVFVSKARVSQKIHCGSRVRFGGRALVDWLEPSLLYSERGRQEFLDALRNAKPWVQNGNSKASRLVQELSWGGRMFGSFTRAETTMLEQWIDSLKESPTEAYWGFIGQSGDHSKSLSHKRDVLVDYPVFDQPSVSLPELEALCEIEERRLRANGSVNIKLLLPLWLSHPCLLEAFVRIPSRAASKSGCAITRLLRAQAGFCIEGDFVEGMDEVRQSKQRGLIEIGLEMAQLHENWRPESLAQALERWPSECAVQMLQLSMRPIRHANILLGMAKTFVELHAAIVETGVLSNINCTALKQIVTRENAALDDCLLGIEACEKAKSEFCIGRNMTITWIESCFTSGENH